MSETEKRDLAIKAVMAAGTWFVAIVSAFALAGRFAVIGAVLVTLSVGYVGLWALFREWRDTPELVVPDGSSLASRKRMLLVGKLAFAGLTFAAGTAILGFSLRSPEKSSLMGVARAVQEELGGSGARRSVGNGYQVLRDYSGDGRLEWSFTTSCGDGKISWRGLCWSISEDVFAAIREGTETRSDISAEARKNLVSFIDRVRAKWRAGDYSHIAELAWALNPLPLEPEREAESKP